MKRCTYPPTCILNPRFVYVPAAQTDIRQTFARIKAEQAARDTQAVPLRKKEKR